MTNLDKDLIKPEIYQIIYQSYQDRNNQLSALNHAMLGFTVAFLAVMITIYSTVFSDCNVTYEQKVGFLFFIVFVSILELTLWRVYANHIDKTIITCYQKIIYCEDNLNISNIKSLSLRESLRESRFDRGHLVIDILAYAIGILSCTIFLYQIPDGNSSIDAYGILYVTIFIFVLILTAIWIACIRNQKREKLNEFLKENVPFNPAI